MKETLVFDEINALRGDLEAQIASGEKLSTEDCIDEVLDILITSYVFGTTEAQESLGFTFSPDTESMQKVIEAPIKGKTFRERISEYAPQGDIDSIIRVAETDSHRVYNTSAYDTAVKGGAKYKTWTDMGDDRVRDTHSYLNGTKIPIDAEFYTYTGEHALYPSGFGTPEEDINCRCWLTYSKD